MSFFALGAFGIAVGIPAALGFVRGNVLLLMGSLAAATLARRLLSPDSDRRQGKEGAPSQGKPAIGSTSRQDAGAASLLWFPIICWSLLAAAWSVGTFDLRQAVAAQAVLGPAALASGTWLSAVSCLGFVAGLVSSVYSAGGSQSIARTAGAGADAWLRWGEAALFGSVISAAYFGPSLGALTAGPSAPELQRGTAASFLLTCAVVAALSWSRRVKALPRPRAVQLVCAGSALAAVGAGAFGL